MMEVLTVAEMSRADGLAVAAGVPSLDLMEAAGAAVARQIATRWPAGPVAVLCGPGNNGGDGFVIARLLAESGWPVTLALLGDRARLKGDAAANAERWPGEIVPLEPGCLEGAAIVVDALFGAGLARAVDGPALAMIEEINRRRLTCVGVDVPSGVDGDTGAVLGAAPDCALSVSFFRAKPGHLLYPGRQKTGELFLADIGIPPSVLGEIAPRTYWNRPELWSGALPRANSQSHKYARGHAVVVGGGEMTGAARLAAGAARRVGVGMLTIVAPPDAVPVYQAGDPGNLVVSVADSGAFEGVLGEKRCNAVLVGPGCGLGMTTRRRVHSALRAGLSVVLDADALSEFEAEPEDLFSAIRGPCVLTPHEGEFGRLFDFTGDKLSRSRAAAGAAGAAVLLKGADTVIAEPGGRAAINTGAPAELATAGSGDVLAGIIVGLLAQGMPPFEAAAAGAWLHGEAACGFGPGLIAEDLADRLPGVLAPLFADRQSR